VLGMLGLAGLGLWGGIRGLGAGHAVLMQGVPATQHPCPRQAGATAGGESGMHVSDGRSPKPPDSQVVGWPLPAQMALNAVDDDRQAHAGVFSGHPSTGRACSALLNHCYRCGETRRGQPQGTDQRHRPARPAAHRGGCKPRVRSSAPHSRRRTAPGDCTGAAARCAGARINTRISCGAPCASHRPACRGASPPPPRTWRPSPASVQLLYLTLSRAGAPVNFGGPYGPR
jgi:hypothetical protein